jgi:hypothetical protein
MSSGYGERGGYGPPQQQPGGYPQQGYGAPPVGAPLPQGPPAPAAKRGPSSGLVWTLLVITALNLLLTAYIAYEVYSVVSAFTQLGQQLQGSLGGLNNLPGSGGTLGG